MTLEAALASPDYRLITKPSGEAALQYLFDSDNCAVILMDVSMPGMDGFETASIIRKHEGTQQVPIIFISAIFTDREHRLTGIQAGAMDYLAKPFEPDTLKVKVEWLVTLFARERAARQESRLVREQAYQLFLSAPLPIVVTRGKDHVLELTNDAWNQLAGDRDCRGQPLRDAVRELKNSGLCEVMDGVYQTGQRYEGKAVILGFRNREGPVTLDITCEPWLSADGQVERIVIFAVDVTEKILSQHRLKNLARELAEPLLLRKSLQHAT